MADERKKLVWTVKKGLFRLSAEELFQITTAIPQTPDQDPAKLNKHDEEACMDYICSYMESTVLLELEDEGMSQILFLKDMIGDIISNRKQGGGDFTVYWLMFCNLYHLMLVILTHMLQVHTLKLQQQLYLLKQMHLNHS